MLVKNRELRVVGVEVWRNRKRERERQRLGYGVRNSENGWHIMEIFDQKFWFEEINLASLQVESFIRSWRYLHDVVNREEGGRGICQREKRKRKKEIRTGRRFTLEVRHRGEDRGRTARATRNLARRHYSWRVPSSNGTESNCVGAWKKRIWRSSLSAPRYSPEPTSLLLCQLLRRPVPAPDETCVSHARSAFGLPLVTSPKSNRIRVAIHSTNPLTRFHFYELFPILMNNMLLENENLIFTRKSYHDLFYLR